MVIKAVFLFTERALLISAGLSLCVFTYFQIQVVLADERAGDFRSLRQFAFSEPDTTLWSSKRLAKYQAAVAGKPGHQIGVLTIPKVEIIAPIYEGVASQTLDLGIGRIPGTARFGESGNTGVAAHRDGFFRGLANIEMGDRIEVQTMDGDITYKVVETKIVLPTDVSVLAPKDDTLITLVTCYPFYFVGSAPKRFIVHAKQVESKRYFKPI